MSRYKAYPEYKDSGVEWLGIVPANWRVKKLKHIIFSLDSGVSVNAADVPAQSNEIGVLKTSCVYTRLFRPEENKTVLVEEIPRVKCPVRKGEIVISRMNTPELVGASALVDVDAKNLYLPDRLWQTNFANPNEQNAKFIAYFMMIDGFRSQITLAAEGASSSMQNITQNDYLSINVAYPDLMEQQKIANFLDHETAKIDTLIAKQQELIKLLKEKRQAVISHAVTKGLNPNAPMRDAGVEWLGEVPAHWEIQKFKHMFEIRKRIAGELGYDVLSITQKGIKIKDIESGDGQLSMDYSKYQIVEKGDFAMNHMDLLTGFVDISMFDGVTSPDYRVFALSDENSVPEYFLCYLQMGYLNRIFFPFGQGAATIGRWRLPTEAFNEFPAPKPPKDEQRQISEFIQRTIAHMELVEEKATFAIQVMKERRTALISAAVTGKIDVRDWQPPSESAIAA